MHPAWPGCSPPWVMSDLLQSFVLLKFDSFFQIRFHSKQHYCALWSMPLPLPLPLILIPSVHLEELRAA